MPDKIVVLSDGTGNSSAKVWRTNVWRTFEFLDLTGADQVAMYDDGVGTSSFLPLALLGGAFGWGLKRNVIDLYKFVCRNYQTASATQPASKIYGFGFSRGAFTIRVLMAFILHQGLAPYISEDDLAVRARSAYRAFRSDRFHSILRIEWIFRKIRDAALWFLDLTLRRQSPDLSRNRKVEEIEFVGLWDTVAAYGLPTDEMTRGVSEWIWPLELPDRVLAPQVKRACHALSIDDQRTTFHPVLWTEADETPATPDANGDRWVKDERISQVWFTGVHANVGGGYPDDALAYIPLYWIMNEAHLRGLKFKAPPLEPDAFKKAASARDKDGREYDSRAGVAGYYRYGPRKIADLCNMQVSARSGDTVKITEPKIHESVLQRLRSDTNAYAPIGLPTSYAVVSSNGKILSSATNPYETPAEAQTRTVDQERVWNVVWLRRIVYFATLIASLHLAAFWAFHSKVPSHEFDSPIALISQLVRFVESFLPYQVVRWWTDYYATNPASFAIGVIALAVLIGFAAKLEGKISDTMRFLWKQRATAPTIQASALNASIRDFRTSVPYRSTIWGLKYYILPFLSAVAVVYVGAVALNHLAFNIIDPTGALCHGTDKDKLERLSDSHTSSTGTIIFPTSSLCFATGVGITRGYRYAVFITPDEPWRDDDLQPTTPSGFRSAEVPSWHRPLMYFGMPLRRDYFRRWFTVIARIGSRGMDEDYLDPSVDPPNQTRVYSGVTNRIQRDGELFLYVNDAVVGLPGLFGVFYDNNKGTAHIRVQRLGR